MPALSSSYGIEGFLRDSCMLSAAGTVCDIAARCAVTGREEKQRQGEEFVGIHPSQHRTKACAGGHSLSWAVGAHWDPGVLLTTP